jgi:predicted transcriptional regulator
VPDAAGPDREDQRGPGERLKRDKVALHEAKDRIEELETQIEELQEGSTTYQAEISQLKDGIQEQARELAGLRSRNNLSQKNWLNEKEDMKGHS